jgi:hypothetical protein
MYRSGIVILSIFPVLAECAISPVQNQKVQHLKSEAAAKPPAAHRTFILAGPVYVPEFYGWNTAAAVSNIVLSLTRAYPSKKTLWSVQYDYYNGSWTWEWHQELDIFFADQNGIILTPTHIRIGMPSQHCIFNNKPIKATNHGSIDFDFTRTNVVIVASGRTTVGPSSALEDHKC